MALDPNDHFGNDAPPLVFVLLNYTLPDPTRRVHVPGKMIIKPVQARPERFLVCLLPVFRLKFLHSGRDNLLLVEHLVDAN